MAIAVALEAFGHIVLILKDLTVFQLMVVEKAVRD
jgi:hypothetical protein